MYFVVSPVSCLLLNKNKLIENANLNSKLLKNYFILKQKNI